MQTQAPLPSRPHPSAFYQPADRLADLAGSFRFALPPSKGGGATAEETEAEIVDFALTARLSGCRLADTFSWGVFRLPSGRPVHACTTFGRKGFLLLEVAKEVSLSPAELSAVARAFVAGHLREYARQSRRGVGRN